MIKSWKHRGLQEFFEDGSTRGIQKKHANKLAEQLSVLNVIKGPQEIIVPSWRLHKLKGQLKEHYSIKVSGNWRLTFRFEDEDVVLVNYQDYH